MLMILTVHPAQSTLLYLYTHCSAVEWHVQLTDHPSRMVCPAGWTMWPNGMSSPHVYGGAEWHVQPSVLVDFRVDSQLSRQ